MHGRLTVRPRSNVCVWRIFCASQCSGFCLERGDGDFHCSRLSVHWDSRAQNAEHKSSKKACAECFFRMRFRPLNTTSTGTVRELAPVLHVFLPSLSQCVLARVIPYYSNPVIVACVFLGIFCVYNAVTGKKCSRWLLLGSLLSLLLHAMFRSRVISSVTFIFMCVVLTGVIPGPARTACVFWVCAVCV